MTFTAIHFGDLHLWRVALEADPFPKRILGLGNLALRRARIFPRPVAARLLDRLAGETADRLLFSGDLTTTALGAEFELARDMFKSVCERWGERFVAIPGNHDVYTPKARRLRRFQSVFADAFAGDARIILNDGWALVCVDQCVPRWVSAAGRMDEDAFARLDSALAVSDGRRAIVMGHYPVFYPADVSIKGGHALAPQIRARLAEILERHGAAAYLHGHKHKRWRLARPGGVTYLDCGAAGMLGGAPDRSPGYLKIQFGADGVEMVTIHWLDGDAWRETPLQAQSTPDGAR